MMNPIEEYVDQIETGKINAPKRIIKVYTSLLDDLREGDKYYYDPDAAERVIHFTEKYCKQSKDQFAGQSLKLCLFQKAKFAALYGTKRKEDDLRRFRECNDFRGRKNGKSVEQSALGLYHLIFDHEGGAEVYCVATKLDQAKRVFDESVNMVHQSKALSMNLKKRKTDLYFAPRFSVFRPLATDSNTLDGLNASCVIMDELHAIKDRHLYDVMKRSQSARRQPMFLIITTAGTVRDNIYDEIYGHASAVADGTIRDDELLPLIYQLDDASKWQDPEMWIQANPGLYKIKSFEYLQKQVERAKQEPNELRNLLCYEFNIVQTGEQTWMNYDDINNPATFTLDDVRDTYAIGGCDLSATTDLTCATLLIKKRNDPMLYVLQQYFLPQSRIDYLEGTASKEAPYQKWAERGLLTICEGSMVDYKAVTAWFMSMRDKYSIDMWKCGYDRALAGYWQDDMKANFGDSTMEKVAQGAFTWTAPMKELGAKLKDKMVNYNDNPILKWCMTNVGVKSSGSVDSIMPVKINQNRRIDGFVSLLNAYTLFVKYKDDYCNLIGDD